MYFLDGLTCFVVMVTGICTYNTTQESVGTCAPDPNFNMSDVVEPCLNACNNLTLTSGKACVAVAFDAVIDLCVYYDCTDAMDGFPNKVFYTRVCTNGK